MLGNSAPFPWWLWLLAGLWGVSLVLRRRAKLSTDWQRGVDLLIGVYTVLLIDTTIRSATPAGLPSDVVDLAQSVTFWCGAVLSVTGGILAFTTGAGSLNKWGHIAAIAGIALLAMRWQAYELGSLCLLICAASSISRSAGEESSGNACSAAARDAWVISLATIVICVIWMGSLQYAFRVESQRPGPSRWYTAIPSTGSAARARGIEDEPGSSATLTWSGLALAGALAWSAWRSRHSSATSEELKQMLTASPHLIHAEDQ